MQSRDWFNISIVDWMLRCQKVEADETNKNGEREKSAISLEDRVMTFRINVTGSKFNMHLTLSPTIDNIFRHL